MHHFTQAEHSDNQFSNINIKTTEQRTVIQQYGDWYTGRWWVSCYIWYSEERPGRAAAPPCPLLAVPNVTAHPSTAIVPSSCYSMWRFNCLFILKGYSVCAKMQVSSDVDNVSDLLIFAAVPSLIIPRYFENKMPHTSTLQRPRMLIRADQQQQQTERCRD